MTPVEPQPVEVSIPGEAVEGFEGFAPADVELPGELELETPEATIEPEPGVGGAGLDLSRPEIPVTLDERPEVDRIDAGLSDDAGELFNDIGAPDFDPPPPARQKRPRR